ncbi:MAG: DUF1810 domain-containing protein [Sedimenticolaceae bacterium]
MTQRKNEDPFQLERFVEAQQGVYDTALSELKSGRKRSHWMWFIFPQIDGLARSSTASYFAIRSIDEAKAYLEHPVLGSRLQECTRMLLGLNQTSASDVFGYPDDLKFCSSMTLFDHAAPDNDLFEAAIIRYCAGERDQKTSAILGGKKPR